MSFIDNFMNRIKQQVGTLVTSAYFWLCVIAVVLVIEGILSVMYWDELSGTDSAGATIRNIGLVIAGSVALPVAIWRGIIADRQAKAAQRQSEAALRQSDAALRQSQTSQRSLETAQRSLLNERYQKGAEMLGNNILSVRLGGIYALQRLAEEYPKEYHIQIMELFCQFARYPVRDENMEGEQGKGRFHSREDVQAVMNAIGNRDEKRIKIEKENGFRLALSNVKLQRYNMSHANLSQLRFGVDDSSKAQFNPSSVSLRTPNFSDVYFTGANLSGADFYGANFSGSQFLFADLSGAIFWEANLSGANFNDSNLSGANFNDSNLSGANFNDSNLSGANFNDSNLSGASFLNANLSGANFNDSNLSGATFNLSDRFFQPAINLTQAQLDKKAVADPDNPPKLEGLVDPYTGAPLIWRGTATPKN